MKIIAIHSANIKRLATLIFILSITGCSNTPPDCGDSSIKKQIMEAISKESSNTILEFRTITEEKSEKPKSRECSTVITNKPYANLLLEHLNEMLEVNSNNENFRNLIITKKMLNKGGFGLCFLWWFDCDNKGHLVARHEIPNKYEKKKQLSLYLDSLQTITTLNRYINNNSIEIPVNEMKLDYEIKYDENQGEYIILYKVNELGTLKSSFSLYQQKLLDIESLIKNMDLIDPEIAKSFADSDLTNERKFDEFFDELIGQKSKLNKEYEDESKLAYFLSSKLELCSACSDNIARLYFTEPNSKCAILTKKALSGNDDDIRVLQEYPSYCVVEKW